MSEPRLVCFIPRCRAGYGYCKYSHQKPPSGQRAPPFRYHARFTGSLRLCPWNWTPSLLSGGPRVFQRPDFPAVLPPPQVQNVQGRTRDLEPGQGASHGSAPCGADLGMAGPTPIDLFSRGESGLHSARAAKILALAETPPPCSEEANVDRWS